MKKVIVFGAGMVGSTISFDLSAGYDVTIVDIADEKLDAVKNKYNLKTLNEDVVNPKIVKRITDGSDLVISAVPGFLGFNVLKNIIEAGKDVVDISFFEEDPFELGRLAKQKNVTAVVDCGVAPGLSNIILGYHNKKMKVEEFECFVGGLPFKRELPYQYKAPFSPVDVIEEYIRPARLISAGKIVVKPALSDYELIDIEPIGTLEAFNTDGLRTLLKTMNIPDMKEKTLRYPGHTGHIKLLIETGFFSKEEVDINGKKIKPIDLSSKLLFSKWNLLAGEREFTILRIKISGKEEGKDNTFIYNIFDKFDEKNNISSMARTTGFTCTAVAGLLLNKIYTKKGISPPEYIGMDGICFRRIMKYLGERNIEVKNQ